MTREAKRKLIKSKAAQQAENHAINKYVSELEASLKAAGIREEKLKEELKDLKSELKTTRSQLRQTKSTNKELRAKTGDIIQRFDSKIKKLGKISTPKIGASSTKGGKVEGFGGITVRRVAERAKRSKDEWLNQNKLNFINQFMERLKSDFPEAADKQKLEQLRVKLEQLDAATIDTVLQGVDEEFRTQYYESDALASYVGKGKEEFLDRLFQAFGII